MYNLSEKQEIARAVALKVNSGFSDVGMNRGESFFEAQKAYNNTLKQRAIRFLKELDKKLEKTGNELTNKDISAIKTKMLGGR